MFGLVAKHERWLCGVFDGWAGGMHAPLMKVREALQRRCNTALVPLRPSYASTLLLHYALKHPHQMALACVFLILVLWQRVHAKSACKRLKHTVEWRRCTKDNSSTAHTHTHTHTHTPVTNPLALGNKECRGKFTWA